MKIPDPSKRREKAARNRGKYSGMSSAEARHHRSKGSLSTNDSGSFSKNSSRGLGDATADRSPRPGETERRNFTPSVASQQNHTNVSSQSATSNATTVETAGLSSSSSHAQSTESRHDAFASQPMAGAVPKIIFRDVPIRQDEVPQQLSAFEPPPRASTAAIQAVNYSSGMSGATAAPVAPTSAGSIDDLLGGLSAQSAPVTSSAPVTNPSSSLADLDSLYGAPPSMPQAAPAQRKRWAWIRLPWSRLLQTPRRTRAPHARPPINSDSRKRLCPGWRLSPHRSLSPSRLRLNRTIRSVLSSFGSPTAAATRSAVRIRRENPPTEWTRSRRSRRTWV